MKQTMTLILVLACFLPTTLWGRDLDQIRASGVIRHIGVPYANFVTGSGDGMDVELVKQFARQIGVRYQYVKTSWSSAISDLTGKRIKVEGNHLKILGEAPVKGDIIANGLTVLAWRKEILSFSTPTFPTQVWVLARADSPIQPIIPGNDIQKDILKVKQHLNGQTILCVANTCLDPVLYNIRETGATPRLFPLNLNQLAPAIISGEAHTTLLDVPDALIAIDKWPGKIKVIGPISGTQDMAAAFCMDAPKLKEAFNTFLAEIKADGSYRQLVQKYYPAVMEYYPEFFR